MINHRAYWVMILSLTVQCIIAQPHPEEAEVGKRGNSPYSFTFSLQKIDFWNEKSSQESTQEESPTEDESYSLWRETITLPDGRVSYYLPQKELLELLENPTPENARKYLEREKEKIQKIIKAYEVLQSISKEQKEQQEDYTKLFEYLPEDNNRYILLYFKDEGCIYCYFQDSHINDFLLKTEGISVYDVYQSSPLFIEMKIQKTPSLVFLDKDTKKIVRLEELHTSEQLAEIFEDFRGGEK